MITDDELRQLLPKLPQPQRLAFIPLLQNAMSEFGITTRLRRAAFLAQVAHESQELTRFVENLNYSAERLRKVFPKRFPNDAIANAFARQPEKLGNSIYANRLGNGSESSGDGFRYRGRGAIQLTGRENYRTFGNVLSLNLEGNPDQAAAPEVAFRTAGAFWKSKGCNELADQLANALTIDAKFEELTKRINGGKIGLAERRALFEKAKLVLKDEAPTPAARGAASRGGVRSAVKELDVPPNLSRGIYPGEEFADAKAARKASVKKSGKKSAKKAATKSNASKKTAVKKAAVKKSSSKKGVTKKSGKKR